jgi:hypothetical protein
VSGSGYGLIHATVFIIISNNKKFWEELIAYISLTRHGTHRKKKWWEK